MLAVPLMILAATLPAAPASVKVVDCSVEESSAAFYARMRPVEGSERMSMRFTVLERHVGGYEPISARGLSRWHRSRPGVAGFGFRQTVRGLQAGGVYRAQVSFRWHSPEGELIERARRTSPACRQYHEVPNLTSAVLGIGPAKPPGVLRYEMRISNEGPAAAEDVDARLSVDGNLVDTVTIPSLEPGESRDVAVLGPACTSSVSSMADPGGVIVESSEADNGHSVDCQA
jgi:CARDB